MLKPREILLRYFCWSVEIKQGNLAYSRKHKKSHWFMQKYFILISCFNKSIWYLNPARVPSFFDHFSTVRQTLRSVFIRPLLKIANMILRGQMLLFWFKKTTFLKIIQGSEFELYRKGCLCVEFYHDVTRKDIVHSHHTKFKNPVISLVTFTSCDVMIKFDT